MDNNKHVFISYKVEDFDKAIAVKNHLEENYITCWMAPMSIRGGMSYAQEIPQAIRNCGVFLLKITEKAQESKWVPRELDQAINCGKIIMPYILENCPLRNDFSFYLTNVQHYDAFRDPQDALKRMTVDIQKLLNITPPPKVEEQQPIPQESAPQAPVTTHKTKPVAEKKKPKDKKKKKFLFFPTMGTKPLSLPLRLMTVGILLADFVQTQRSPLTE